VDSPAEAAVVCPVPGHDVVVLLRAAKGAELVPEWLARGWGCADGSRCQVQRERLGIQNLHRSTQENLKVAAAVCGVLAHTGPTVRTLLITYVVQCNGNGVYSDFIFDHDLDYLIIDSDD
jgi:hypothetical protein